MDIPEKEKQQGIEIEKEHKPTITDIFKTLDEREPSEEELLSAYEGIVEDHEKETVDATGKPEYYEEHLIPMEEKMKKESFIGVASIDELIKVSKELTTKERKKLPKSDFVFPKEKKYPIHDKSHAQNALARVEQHGTPEEKKKVQNAVDKEYPGLRQKDKKK